MQKSLFLATTVTGLLMGAAAAVLSEEDAQQADSQYTVETSYDNQSPCRLAEGLPPLDIPEAVNYTNNGSDLLVINVWDQDHTDKALGNRINLILDEIIDKWEVKLIGEEGYAGRLGDDPNIRDSAPEYSPAWKAKGVSRFGIDPLMRCYEDLLFSNYRREEICGNASDSQEDQSQIESPECFNRFKALIDEDCGTALADGAENVNDLKNRLGAHDEQGVMLFDSIGSPFRSYAAMEAILELMESEGQTRIAVVFGYAHRQQMNRYLDSLGISHVDVILDDALHRKLEERYGRDPELRFSEQGLNQYKRFRTRERQTE